MNIITLRSPLEIPVGAIFMAIAVDKVHYLTKSSIHFQYLKIIGLAVLIIDDF